MTNRIEAIKRLRADGRSDVAIAHMLGVSRQRVHALAGPRKGPPAASNRVLPYRPKTPSPEAFAAALKTWRAKRSFTQEQAARTLCVNTRTLRAWEQGHISDLAAMILLLLEKMG